MSLSLKEKNELRKEIEEKLKEVPEGALVKFDKELLEDLLFDEILYNEDENLTMRLPVWSGKFLQKIDLSEVDFTNVSWARLGAWDDYDFKTCVNCASLGSLAEADKYVTKVLMPKYNEMFKNSAHNQYKIEYNNTNANIDLAKSFEVLNENTIIIIGCDFSGLDFSDLDYSEISGVVSFFSNIGDTGFDIPEDVYICAHCSNLNGIELPETEIDARNYFKVSPDNLSLCSLRDCRVRISLHQPDFAGRPVLAKRNSKVTLAEELQKAVFNQWIGCYLNDKECSSREVRAARAQVRLEKHNKEKQKTLDIINNSFKEIRKGAK